MKEQRRLVYLFLERAYVHFFYWGRIATNTATTYALGGIMYIFLSRWLIRIVSLFYNSNEMMRFNFYQEQNPIYVLIGIMWFLSKTNS